MHLIRNKIEISFAVPSKLPKMLNENIAARI